MDWDNLRFFLELSRSGKLVNAARRLDVDHTTVSRRLRTLEKAIGTPLFTREPAGFELTEAGRRLLPHAESMESAWLAIDRATPAADAGLSGPVRIGATEGFGVAVLAPELARFAAGHPHLAIDLLALPRLVNLSRREADIVIALERPSRGPFIVARLTDYTLRLYASAEYLARLPGPIRRDDLPTHPFVGYVDDLLFSKELQSLNELGRPRRFSLRSTSVLAQQQAIASGTGIGVLPAFLADRDPRLKPLLPESANLTRTFWMSMPVEVKHLPRMQAVWQFLRDTATRLQPLLTGRTDDGVRPESGRRAPRY
ncbi:MAG: LysR family transcriptional regulator [Burkholderiaceae bacterium]